jgi:hypothetical protein
MSQSCCQIPAPEEPQKDDLKVKVLLYKPLIIITLISLFAALEMAFYDVMPFMNALMGLFLIFLAALKFFDTKGFAEVFSKYDPLAARVKGYAYVYPFIELGLGVMYFAGSYPLMTNILLIVVFAINTVGVMKVIRGGAAVKCGCAGAGFNLPVGRVTLAENLIMIAMGLANILL